MVCVGLAGRDGAAGDVWECIRIVVEDVGVALSMGLGKGLGMDLRVDLGLA